MLLPLKALCEAKRTRKDGRAIIFLQFCYSSEKRTLLNTQIAIPPQYWNARKMFVLNTLPDKYGLADDINKELQRQYRLVEDLIFLAKKKGVTNIGQFIKAVFNPKMEIVQDSELSIFNKKANPAEFFISELNNYILSKQKRITLKAIASLNSLRMHLQAFDKYRNTRTSFDSLDYNWYELFIEFLTFDYPVPRKKVPEYGLKPNSIGKTIKQLRIFIKDRVKRKIISPVDLSDFKIQEEETDAIYLTENEVLQINSLDLYDNPELKQIKSLFVFACLTGLRFSDFSSIKSEDIRNGMVYKKQLKSDNWVVIPLKKEALEILSKEFNKGFPKISNPVFNRQIKAIGRLAGLTELITFSYKKGGEDIIKMLPKHGWITSHTARRSFCTNEFLAGTPAKLIMQISGHKNERDFYRYIRITPEESAIKIQEIWNQRNNMVTHK